MAGFGSRRSRLNCRCLRGVRQLLTRALFLRPDFTCVDRIRTRPTPSACIRKSSGSDNACVYTDVRTFAQHGYRMQHYACHAGCACTVRLLAGILGGDVESTSHLLSGRCCKPMQLCTDMLTICSAWLTVFISWRPACPDSVSDHALSVEHPFAACWQ